MRHRLALGAVAALAGSILRGTALAESAGAATQPVGPNIVKFEVSPTNLVAGQSLLIRVMIASNLGIDDWYCMPKLNGQYLAELRFGDVWDHGFERPRFVNRFFERKLERPGDYELVVMASDAEGNKSASAPVRVRVSPADAKGKAEGTGGGQQE